MILENGNMVERLETLKVRPVVKTRLDLLQVQAKAEGRRLTQSDLIEEILDDLARLKDKSPDPNAPKTARERERVRQLMCVMRTETADVDMRMLQEHVLRTLDVWQRLGPPCP